MRQHEGRGRVAGDDRDIGYVVRNQPLHHRNNPRRQSRFRQGAIRKAGVVRGVDEFRIRAQKGDFPRKRSGRRGGIEHENFGRVSHAGNRIHFSALSLTCSGDRIDSQGQPRAEHASARMVKGPLIGRKQDAKMANGRQNNAFGFDRGCWRLWLSFLNRRLVYPRLRLCPACLACP